MPIISLGVTRVHEEKRGETSFSKKQEPNGKRIALD
jgi:hypothetical protein